MARFYPNLLIGPKAIREGQEAFLATDKHGLTQIRRNSAYRRLSVFILALFLATREGAAARAGTARDLIREVTFPSADLHVRQPRNIHFDLAVDLRLASGSKSGR